MAQDSAFPAGRLAVLPGFIARLRAAVYFGCARPCISVARHRPFPETGTQVPRSWARMLAFLWKGVLVGLIIAVPVGPVGVLCIRRTIFDGRLAGFISGTGAATADAIFGIIAGFGLTFVSDLLLEYQEWLRIGGAGFLLYFGFPAFTPHPLAGTQSQRDPETLLADFASTFALTLTNPITILAFLAIFAGIGFAGEGATLGGAAVLVLGVWLGSLLWWAAISLGAGMFRH